ncbi:hypothetical protein TNCV_2623491 [Trichonephila clavipes]|nr:hypothetical protein TNCV_2623491 [Trichonephila clavipes]
MKSGGVQKQGGFYWKSKEIALGAVTHVPSFRQQVYVFSPGRTLVLEQVLPSFIHFIIRIENVKHSMRCTLTVFRVPVCGGSAIAALVVMHYQMSTFHLGNTCPICGHAKMYGDHLLQCIGLDEYPVDDIVSRYWEARCQMGGTYLRGKERAEGDLGQRVRFPTGEGDRFNSCQVIYSQFGLAIHQNDYQARRRFVEWAQNEIAVVPDFHKRILFSDEAHFWLNEYVNKQNCRIWSEANPQVYVETPLHPEKLTVWCALWAGGIIGPY